MRAIGDGPSEFEPRSSDEDDTCEDFETRQNYQASVPLHGTSVASRHESPRFRDFVLGDESYGVQVREYLSELLRVPPCREGSIHLQTSMTAPGFEPRPNGMAVSVTNRNPLISERYVDQCVQG
ncbi:hypothetical protein TNCV_4165091 [Trichonephila clavipes]|nr:hypothetical protein TNCV_4165091 [Trichonephila clavipes]